MPAYYAVEMSMHALPPEAVEAVRSAVDAAGGVIVDATRFSNKALSFKLECYPPQVVRLCEALETRGKVHSACVQPRGAAELGTLPSDMDVLVLLHVALVHDLPDERIELPKVPG